MKPKYVISLLLLSSIGFVTYKLLKRKQKNKSNSIKINERSHCELIEQLYYIPLPILLSYIKIPDLIKLSKINIHFKKYIFLNIKPRLSIKNEDYGFELVKTFKDVQLELCPKGINDQQLLKFNNKIFKLRLFSNRNTITDYSLEKLTNLESLHIYRNNLISDVSLNNLKLTDLSVNECPKITDEGIGRLTSLTSLDISYNDEITNSALKYLINLEKLVLYENKNITNDGLKSLINLTSLNIMENQTITNESFTKLPKLQILYLEDSMITDEGLQKLTTLKELYIGKYVNITDVSIGQLTNLTCLDIFDQALITDFS